MTEELRQPPLSRASDADREAVVGRLEQALAEGRIDVDEFGQRAEAAYAAVTTADLDPLVADLPPHAAAPVEIVGTRSPEALFEVFGDIRFSGGDPVPRRVGGVFGDVDGIVPDGVDAGLEGWTVLGDRKVDLAPVPRLAGTPRIAIRGRSVFGDLRLHSQAPGGSAGRWRALLERLSERRSRTPPPAA